MHSILWASLLASAGVAVVTTLLVEYLAKPSLEARKERILESKREQRAALKSIIRCTFLARRVSVLGRAEGDGYDREVVHVLSTNAKAMAAQIEELATSAYEVFDAPAWMRDEWYKSTVIMMGFSIFFSSIDRPPEDAWKELDSAADRMDDFVTLLTTSNRHLWRKRRLVKKIRSSPFSPSSLSKGNRLS